MVDIEASRTDLRRQLDEATDAKEAQRIMIALAHLDGVSVTTLSERYDLPQSTVYYWLSRFSERSVEDAAADDSRPGRPSELSDAERDELAAVLGEPPREHGYDADEWKADLVADLLEREYGVSYSLGHVRRLLRQLR